MADERDLIRSRIDIVQLVGQRVSLKKAGKNWKGLCPFHEDRNPSFDVSPDRGTYRCWSCGAAGDVFTWVMETEKVDFVDALRILAKEAGVELTNRDRREPSVVEAQELAMSEAQAYFVDQLEKSTVAKDYCKSRNIDEDTIKTWGLGYAPDVSAALATHLQRKGLKLADCESLFLVRKDQSGSYDDRFKGRLMFPIRDERGKLVAFGGRIIGEGIPKYINSGDTPLYSKSRVLYGMDRAKAKMAESRQAVLVEGYLDVIACHRAGVTSAVASLGTSLAEDHVRLLKRWCDEVVVLYDSDAAGQKAAERACELLGKGGLRVRVALVPDGKDPDTLLNQHGAEAVRSIVERPLSEAGYLIAQLEARTPASTEQFWDEAAAILAKSKKHQEIVGLVDSLVPKFPYSKDRTVARLSIERMVKAARAKNRPNRQGRAPVDVGRSTRLDLKGFEAVVIKALLVPELRKEAWAVCQRGELFVSSVGRDIANAVATEFSDAPPDGQGSKWVAQISLDLLRDVLLQMEQEVLPNRESHLVDRDSFHGAVSRMEAALAERQRHEQISAGVSDPAARNAVFERLKQAHGQRPGGDSS